MCEISTPRLSLIQFPHTLMLALIKSKQHFAALSGLKTAPDWPNSDLLDAMAFIASTVQAEPELAAWTRLFVLKDPILVVGEAGFKGLPDAEGVVEIGYGVAQSHRGIGLATEAVLGMCTWAFQQPGVRRIIAECLPENTSSMRLLQRSGFTQTNSDAAMLRWQLPQQIPAARCVH